MGKLKRDYESAITESVAHFIEACAVNFKMLVNILPTLPVSVAMTSKKARELILYAGPNISRTASIAWISLITQRKQGNFTNYSQKCKPICKQNINVSPKPTQTKTLT